MADFVITNNTPGDVFVQVNGKPRKLSPDRPITVDEEQIGEGTRKLQQEGIVSIVDAAGVSAPEPKSLEELVEERDEIREKRKEEKELKKAEEKEKEEKEKKNKKTYSAKGKKIRPEED